MGSMRGMKRPSLLNTLLCSLSSSSLGLNRSRRRLVRRSVHSRRRLDRMPLLLLRNDWKHLRSLQEEKLRRKRLLQQRPRLPAEITETMLLRTGLTDHER